MLAIYQGETLVIEHDVVDEFGVAKSLTGATAYLFYREDGETTVYDKECTITGNTVSITLTATDTLSLLGNYLYELKIKYTTNVVETLKQDRLFVAESLSPEFPSV